MTVYMEKINSFVQRCDGKYLYLNVSKTKDMCIDLGRTEMTQKLFVLKSKWLTELVHISTWV